MKIVGVIALAVLLLLGILLLTGLGGEHGPGRHLPAPTGSRTLVLLADHGHEA